MLRFRSACASAVWSRKMPSAHSGILHSLLVGPVGCDAGFCIISTRFRMLRRFPAYRPGLIGFVSDGAFGHMPVHLHLKSAVRLGFGMVGFLEVEQAWSSCTLSTCWT